MSEYQEELKKLQINLRNAEKTFGRSSAQYLIVEGIIRDFVEKNKTRNPLPTFENLAIRSKNPGS